MNKLVTSLIGVSAFISASVLAGNTTTLNDTFSIPSKGTLHLDVPVGQVILETHDANNIQVRVEVRNESDIWFGDDDEKVNLENAEIKHRNSNNNLYLEINNEKLIQKWTVYMPENTNLELEVGVGEVNLKGQLADIDVEVGVGEVDVELEHNNYTSIELESGVGDVDLDGFKGATQERGMVSGGVEWHGSGDYKIDIEVGVGEVDVER
ncbi:DUF4097 family beta strand repeat-containing protein [Alteromonas sp. a30]|uniref:DUF4097 family beta strand repeat-containing protein n=1 Tax=Alteromonas sp. a30 TaxID=2730917 RepID=UPI002281F5AE|nr:DUF4097 family beta strand repeat-containing protein [Alteromonas sp. a30]MCY7293878.1 DUF4097 family beta strand repeat protein [Alteromonas sp. a30]